MRGKRFAGQALTVSLHELPSLRESGRIDATGLAGAEILPGRPLAHPPGGPAGGAGLRHRDSLHAGNSLRRPGDGPCDRHDPVTGQTWGNYGRKFSPDGKSLAVFYRTGSNVALEGDPDPFDRPMTLEIWEIRNR